MSRGQNNAMAVYAHADEARRSGAGLHPIPSYELYKAAREEELRCYRSLCRVLYMHSAGRLTKQQSRVLEDVREELCIAAPRAEAEMFGAAEDALVTGVAASGILKRREEFFDGVVDVPLDAVQDGEASQDDHNGLYMPPAKAFRTEQTPAPTAHASSRRPQPARMSNAALLKIIEKIGSEVETSSNRLLYSVSEEERAACRRTLQAKRDQLQQLLREVDSQPGDHSKGSSRMPSEHGF